MNNQYFLGSFFMDKKTNNNYLDLKHYYGIPHCHTNYSTGKSSPLEAIDYSKKSKVDIYL